MSTLNKGDIVNLNYTGRTKEDNKVVDTTIESIAKKEGIYDEKVIYRPFTLIIGKHWLPAGLEEALIGMKEGQKKTIEVDAKNGFGLRDRSKIRLIQRREFQRHQIKPKEDMKVEIGGQTGRILKVSSSRVKVDFNHDLAGKDLEFDVKITERIENEKEKIVFVFQRYMPSLAEKDVQYEVNEKSISVGLSPYMLLTEGLQNLVLRVIGDLRQSFGYDKIEFKFAFDFSEVNKEEKKLDEMLTDKAEDSEEATTESEN